MRVQFSDELMSEVLRAKTKLVEALCRKEKDILLHEFFYSWLDLGSPAS